MRKTWITIAVTFAAALLATTTPTRAAATEAASATRVQVAATPSAAAWSDGKTWTTVAGESLDSLARALYPDDANARQRFMRATASTNPSLFSTLEERTRELPPGTRITVPDLRRLASTAPAPKATPKPAATLRPRSPIVAAPATNAHSPEAKATAGVSETDSLSTRKRELGAAIDHSIVAEMELMTRIEELEDARNQIEASIETLGLDRDTSAEVISPPDVAAAPSAPAPDSKLQTEAETNYFDPYLAGGLGIVVLLALLLWRRRANGQSARSGSRPAIQPTTTRTEASATAPKSATAAAAPMATPTPSSKATASDATDAMLEWQLPGTDAAKVTDSARGSDSVPGEQIEEHQSAIELADIMMSFGRLHGAADTLSEFIRGNPKQAVTPWLKLLEVYRAAGLRAEFDAIAKELNRTFNVIAVTWENYDALRTNALSVEHFPHIMEQIQYVWRTRDCQVYLQRLLRDNRDSTRAGFPFSVIDDILMLSAVLEEELGPAIRPEPLGGSR